MHCNLVQHTQHRTCTTDGNQFHDISESCTNCSTACMACRTRDKEWDRFCIEHRNHIRS